MEDVPRDQRLIPSAVDYRFRTTPQRVFAFLPNGDALSDGFYPLNYDAFAAAVNRMAWWLDEVLGGKHTSSEHFPAIAYVGPNDFRYVLLIVAAVKTKRKVCTPTEPGRILSSCLASNRSAWIQ